MSALCKYFSSDAEHSGKITTWQITAIALQKSKFGPGVAVRNLVWNLKPILLALYLAYPSHKHYKREVPPLPGTSVAIWPCILVLAPAHTDWLVGWGPTYYNWPCVRTVQSSLYIAFQELRLIFQFDIFCQFKNKNWKWKNNTHDTPTKVMLLTIQCRQPPKSQSRI